MTDFKLLEKISEENNGVLQTKEALKAGVSKAKLAEFLKENEYEKFSRGIYYSPDTFDDKMYMLQLRFPQIIFSHESALELLEMTDQVPFHSTVTVKSGYNATNIKKENVDVYYIKEELHELGMIKKKTMFGNEVWTYNAERTICDLLRNKSDLDPRTFPEAIKEYVRSSDRDLTKLARYAEVFRVDKVLRPYLEVLL